jgi:hypothetical protein
MTKNSKIISAHPEQMPNVFVGMSLPTDPLGGGNGGEICAYGTPLGMDIFCGFAFVELNNN